MPKKEVTEIPHLLLLLCVFGAVFAAILVYFNLHILHDDAYISLRYVRNFLNGDGLVWNVGERVEGYTNFLFIMLTAVLGALGIDLLLAARIVSALAYLGMFVLLVWYVLKQRDTSRNVRSDYGVILPLFLFVTSAGFIGWIFAGLETDLYCLFVGAGFIFTLLAMRHNGQAVSWLVVASFAYALATLTRPDGGVFFLISFIFVAIFYLLRQPSRFFVCCFALGLPYTIIVLLHIFWRHAYYGEWLPNTFYAKSYGIPLEIKLKDGISYAFEGVFLYAPFLILFGVLAAVSLLRRSVNRLSSLYYLWVSVCYIVYIILSGGDYMHYYRFLIPVIFLSLLSIGWYVADLQKKHQWALLNTYTLVLALAVLLQLSFYETEKIKIVSKVDMGVEEQEPEHFFSQTPPTIAAVAGYVVGNYINEHWAKGAVIAINSVGAMPYFATDYHYIDMLGLVDKHIARRVLDPEAKRAPFQNAPGHYKGDGEYVLSLKPDYIILGVNFGHSKTFPRYLSDMEIIQDSVFEAHYEEVTEWLPVPEYYKAFVRYWAGPVLIPAERWDDGEMAKVEMHTPLGIKYFTLHEQVVYQNDKMRFIYYRRRKGSENNGL
ncbi:MAG: hypothetical protein H6908_03815 [Hyphomicrobiales bacterium]|nr:hypothetical protein [Hyphomicrobiales bacterium]